MLDARFGEILNTKHEIRNKFAFLNDRNAFVMLNQVIKLILAVLVPAIVIGGCRNDGDSQQSLHEAVKRNDIALVKSLLDSGVDVNAKDNKGFSPLHFATSGEVAEILLAQGADVNSKDNFGCTPVHTAAIHGHQEVARVLLDEGVDVNVGEEEAFFTPLHLAAKNGHTALVELLLSRGANVNAQHIGRLTPLHWAARTGKSSAALIKLLLVNGADVNARSNLSETPLFLAAIRGNIAVVELLLANNADVNARDSEGLTPLCRAILGRCPEMVKLLLANGADVIVRYDKHGNTALHLASYVGQQEVVEMLLAKGANVNVKTNSGKTPLDVAVQQGHASVARLIREHKSK